MVEERLCCWVPDAAVKKNSASWLKIPERPEQAVVADSSTCGEKQVNAWNRVEAIFIIFYKKLELWAWISGIVLFSCLGENMMG